MTMTELAAVVLTLNEERYLPDCLRSLRSLACDVIVVDSGSTDKTVEIARSFGVRVEHHHFRGFASQRNAALQFAQHCEWTLFIDADERVTPALGDEIRHRIASASDQTAGFWMPRSNIAFGRALRGGGWWPDYQARIIRRNRGAYDTNRQVHEVVQFAGETQYLDEPLLHLNYESRKEFLRQQRRYTHGLVTAGQIAAPRTISYLSRPVREFVRRFFRLRGYRDGTTGLFMACVMSIEEFRGCVLMRRANRA
jgi:glycosyltransferase involved in cell wall biosynthesis